MKKGRREKEVRWVKGEGRKNEGEEREKGEKVRWGTGKKREGR